MIIDTLKLKVMANNRDDDIDFEKCSMTKLNMLEKRVIDSIKIIEAVEFLAQDLEKERIEKNGK